MNILRLRIYCAAYLTYLKYPSFDLLNGTDKTIFLFNNVDSFICKKLGYFIYEALHMRETCNVI